MNKNNYLKFSRNNHPVKLVFYRVYNLTNQKHGKNYLRKSKKKIYQTSFLTKVSESICIIIPDFTNRRFWNQSLLSIQNNKHGYEKFFCKRSFKQYRKRK